MLLALILIPAALVREPRPTNPLAAQVVEVVAEMVERFYAVRVVLQLITVAVAEEAVAVA